MNSSETTQTYRSRQEIFDIAYRGLAAQGFKQSASECGDCLYRGGDNLKCAVGHLIDDKDYHASMEGLLASSAHVTAPARINPLDRYFAHHLQRAHDNPIPDETVAAEIMKHRLEAFAKEFGLTVPQIEGVPA